MIASVDRSHLSGEVYAPPSKSYSHRAILITALGPGGLVRRPLISADTKATISAATSLGAEVSLKEGDLSIVGVNGSPEAPEDVIDVLNSGTTLRFVSAVAALTEGAVLTGDGSIRSRPNGPLIQALNDLGATAFSIRAGGRAPLVIRGRLKGGLAKLDRGVSSQFLSALLTACPLSQGTTTIAVQGELKSKPYAEITLDMLNEAGASIEVSGNDYWMEGGQSYSLPEYDVPGDFSSTSYLLAAAAVTGSALRIRGIRPSRQGDSAILDILDRMGADIEWNKDAGDLRIAGSGLFGVEVDASHIPDLVPTIAVLGSVAKGRTIIKNAEHVRHKETDRLQAMAQELSKMGADIRERPDGLEISGGDLKGARLSGHHDHRIVMALTVAGMVAGDTVIEGAEAVDVSYPGFFQEMAGIGGQVALE